MIIVYATLRTYVDPRLCRASRCVIQAATTKATAKRPPPEASMTRFPSARHLLLLALTAAFSGCNRPMMNQLSSDDRAAGWRLLFDGQSTAGWRGYKSQAMPEGWRAVDAALPTARSGEDMLSKDQFSHLDPALA